MLPIFLFVFYLMFAFYVLSENKPNKNNNNLQKFDVIYTWVDSYDPERDLYVQKSNSSSSESDKYRYNSVNELLFSLRSLFQYCSDWVGTVYIVVKDGQCPYFIDFNNPQIKLINHSEIIPSFVLPTFNSNAIEMFLHKIPNLSETYVYMNDDMFINKPFYPLTVNNKIGINLPKNYREISKDVLNDLEQKNFSEEDGNGKVPYEFSKMWNNTIYNANKIFNSNLSFWIPHVPSVCYKPWEIQLQTIFKENELWFSTISSKTRTNSNIVINNGFRIFFYLTKTDAEVVHWKEKWITLKSEKRCFFPDLVDKKSFNFFSVGEIDSECYLTFTEEMEKIYPEKSPVEF